MHQKALVRYIAKAFMLEVRGVKFLAALFISIGIIGLTGVGVWVAEGKTLSAPTVVTYRIDPAKSTFMVHADRAGLGWFKGRSHRIAVKDFSGEASLSLDVLNPASLEMKVNAKSLAETDAAFTDKQKGIIKKEIDDLVLETAKYPKITFKSTEVKGSLKNGAFDVRIGGDLTLHGVTKHIVIPAKVTLNGVTLRAVGEFEINRKNFGVNATEAFHGFVKVRHTIKFKFDIIGTRM